MSDNSTDNNVKDDNVPKRRGRGRPTKKEIKAKSKGGRGQVGRPKGDAAIINEYKARMLASPKSEAVLAKVFAVALDDEHKHQAACMKMVMDRMLPISYFEKDKGSKGIGGVKIVIEDAGAVNISSGDVEEQGEVVDADYTEVANGL